MSLQDHLARRIRAAGPIGLDVFMDEALLNPEWGYYATRDPFGARGDFITAPEVSQMFGELIGLCCAELWQRMGAPDPIILAELGPGRGTLMRDALRAAGRVANFRRAARVHFVERSPVLRRIQGETLSEAAPQWHDDVAELPAGPLLLIANEFLDALPIRQFLRAPDGWHERRVGVLRDGSTLAYALDPMPSQEAELFAAPCEGAPLGSLWEARPAALTLARRLGARLARQGGMALFIDYARHAQPWGESLQAVRAHKRHEVLEEPGSADLSALVDFASFGALAEAAGARVLGPVSQGDFLTALGIAARAASLVQSGGKAEEISSAYHRLVDADKMGVLFKVMALVDPKAPLPEGFA